FYSDNGPTTNDVPCAPLNGGKNSTYEAGERVPAFMVWNGHITPASEYQHPIYLGDVFDTILDVAGVNKPKSHDSDGMSLLPVFSGEKLSPREFIWYFPDTRLHWAQRANAAIYDESYGMKYIMFFNGDSDELYDIHNDVAETENIIEQHPEISKKLRNRLVEFLNKYYPKMPPPPEEYQPIIEKRLREVY
ncbi:sulfatase-like hydrolase/transferase, partial [candidate division KSB1 bacterium]|nr:sulfatase-like hydrolase/transferase [candidate division KSB1 bacterium]